jgi:hypothetical protein
VTLFDLAFILLFLAAVVTLLVAAGQALRGRVAEAGRVLRRLGIAAVGYLLVVALAGLVTPRRVLAVGDEQCSDDWCIAVAGVSSAGVGDARRYEVTFRVSSRARRVVQRERNVVVYLRDASGRRYEAQPEPATEPRFDVQLSPGEAVSTVRSFIVPAGARDVGLVVARGGVPFPTCCIIGDEGSVLHKRTVVRLD